VKSKEQYLRPSYTEKLESAASNFEVYQEYSIALPIVPKYKNFNYIGVEIECLINPDLTNKFVTYLVLYNLHDKVVIGDDGSIEDGYNDLEGYEIKLLTTEKTYKQDLFSLSECLRLVEATVNKSCGLHIHLDCYNISSSSIITNLSKFKLFFKSLVPKSRQDNEYTQFKDHYRTHYNWINKTDFGTVEVRCHEGTVNMKAVERFINLLLITKQTKINKQQLTSATKLMKILNLTKTDSNYFLNRIKQFSKPKGDKYYV
jgi:hypothetical protein